MLRKLTTLLALFLSVMIFATGCKSTRTDIVVDESPTGIANPTESMNPTINADPADRVSPAESVKPTDVPTLSPEDAIKVQLNKALEALTLPNEDDIRGNITLCKEVDVEDNSFAVTWSSSDESVIKTTPTGEDGKIPPGVVIRGAEDTSVVLTAELELEGMKATKEFHLIIKAKPAEIEYRAYLYCYFQDNIYGKGQSQHIFLATSTDGLKWKSLNDNKPVLEATLGTKGVRDPFLLRSKEGDKFYILATDLDANGGDWGYYSTRGSRSIAIWESEDLVNWSEQRLVDISPRNAECMWAPEAYYDETTGEYIVYWSASISGGNGKKIYYAKTRDFYTFTQPKIFKDVERNAKNIKNGNGKIESNLTFIDTTMIEYLGTYYRFTKREIDSTILMDASDSILGPFTVIKDKIASENGVEGPSIFQLIGQEKWILMVDGYWGKGYFPLMADSLEKLKEGRFVRLPQIQYKMPPGARHGSFMTISTEEYDAVTAKWGKTDDFSGR